jgi:hypothetical protein
MKNVGLAVAFVLEQPIEDVDRLPDVVDSTGVHYSSGILCDPQRLWQQTRAELTWYLHFCDISR